MKTLISTISTIGDFDNNYDSLLTTSDYDPITSKEPCITLNGGTHIYARLQEILDHEKEINKSQS